MQFTVEEAGFVNHQKLDMRTRSPPDKPHLRLLLLRCLRGADLGVVVVAVQPDGGDGVVNLLIALSGAHHRLQVIALPSEQAGVDRAIGGKPHAGTGAAEGLRDAGDDAELARAILIAAAPGNFPRLLRVDGFAWKHLAHPFYHLPPRVSL